MLGLDGGGSRSRVVVVERDGTVETRHDGSALDPGSCPDWPVRLAALVAAAGPDVRGLRCAVLALPFHTEVERISEAQRRCAAEVFAGPHHVLNDVHAAYEGALAGRAGVLILAGTGSMAWAGDGDGRHCRTGGWGDVFGDEGSAFWVGREALSTATQALDGRRPERDFAMALLDGLGVGPDDLIGWCYGLDARRSAIAALARLVDALSLKGDRTARALLDRAADHLGEHVRAAWRRIGAGRPLVWSHAGGLFESTTVLSRLTDTLGAPAAPRLPPVGGAVLHAARQAGWITDEAWMARLAASLARTRAPEPLRQDLDSRSA